MVKKIDLVLIDPQNSFCKVVPPAEQQILHDGELCVPGAWDDMLRVKDFIDKHGKRLNDIHPTLDSHQPNHIAHPCWFKDGSGNRPAPFTIMREEKNKIIGNLGGNDVGEYTTFLPSLEPWTLDYLKALMTNKRYPHCIWPPHCLIGTPGHNIVAPLAQALIDWATKYNAVIPFVTKGSNYRTEHFGAVRAEVIDPDDPNTQLNSRFIAMLMEADEILFAGEAGSHCLANTVRDVANEFAVDAQGNVDDSFIKKCVLLTDATSPVPGFEKYQDDFIAEMTKRGMKISTTKDYF